MLFESSVCPRMEYVELFDAVLAEIEQEHQSLPMADKTIAARLTKKFGQSK